MVVAVFKGSPSTVFVIYKADTYPVMTWIGDMVTIDHIFLNIMI